MTLFFTYILFVLMPMILNQVYVDASNGLQCIECDDYRQERFCRESIGDNGLSSFTAFTATLSGKHVKWLKGDIIKYSRILTNIGNRYDPSTGIFTVETPGVYSVSTSMIGGIRQCTLATLRKNGNILVWLFTGPKWDMASQTIYIAMVKGDKIWVQIQSNILKLNVKHIYHHLSAVLIKPGKF